MSLKLEPRLVRQIETDMKDFNFSTKTEFIREAIRDKIAFNAKERAKQMAWDALFATRGVFKGQGKARTDEEWYRWRMETSEQLAKEFEAKFGF